MSLFNVALNKLVTTNNVVFNTYTPNKIVNGNFDSNDGFLCKDNGVSVLLKITLDKPYIIKQIKLKQLIYNDVRRCKEFDIKASNNDIDYNIIMSGTLLNNDNLQEFILNNNNGYKYWCIVIKNNYSGESGWSNGIGEVELYTNLYKYLIKQNDQYYTIKSEFYKNGNYEPIKELEGKEILEESDFKIYGIDDLNLLTQDIEIEEETFKPKNKLKLINNGKFDIFTKEME